MDKKARSKRSRSKKMVKKETEHRFYHSAHGSLSTKKKYINENEVPSTFGYPETHFVNGEKKTDQVYPIKVGKDVSGVKGTIYFKINADMYAPTQTGDNSKAETAGKKLANLDKFHILFTIEVEGKGNEFIIKKVLVHPPSMVEGVTLEEHVEMKSKYTSASQPPEVFYDGRMMTKNIPNLEFFYEAHFNTGFCAIDSDNRTQRVPQTDKLWWKTYMMKINKIKDEPGLDSFPMNDTSSSSSKSSSSSESSKSTTLQEMFRELGRIDIYDNILDDYDITENPGDYDESETKLQMEIMKDELVEYLEEASEIYFHHPDPRKSLLSAILTKATFSSKPGDHLSVTIFNSTCLVNQKRPVGDHEVFTENPVEDRMRYPDFYRLYEGPMDRSILLKMVDLSYEVSEANRLLDYNIESIARSEKQIKKDKQLIKKWPELGKLKSTYKKESVTDRIKRYKEDIKMYENENTEYRAKIEHFEQEINISKKQQKAQKVVKTLDAQVLQPGTKRAGRLKKKKKKGKREKGKKDKGKKEKASKKRRNRYTRRR